MKEKGIKVWVVVLLVILFWPAALIYVLAKSKGKNSENKEVAIENQGQEVNSSSASGAAVVMPLNLDLEATGLIYEIKGAQKILRIYDDRVTLEQVKNARALLSQNWFQGIKEIYYSDMLGLQCKEASKFVLGYIQFETASSRGGDNFNSENSWTYDMNVNVSNTVAKEIQEFVRKKIRLAKNPQPQQSQQVSTADEMLKWKSLYDAGVISEEEFNEKKKASLK